MKTFRLFGMALLMVIVCCSFSACSSEDDERIENITASDITGTWFVQEVEFDYKYCRRDLEYFKKIVENYKGEKELKNNGTVCIFKLPSSDERGAVRITLNDDLTWFQEIYFYDGWIFTDREGYSYPLTYDFDNVDNTYSLNIKYFCLAPLGLDYSKMKESSFYLRANSISFEYKRSSDSYRRDYQILSCTRKKMVLQENGTSYKITLFKK